MRNSFFISKQAWLVLTLLLLGLSQSGAAVTNAAPIRLAWNPASDVNVKGYAVYYGLANQAATNRIDVGTNLTCTLSSLIAEVTYRIYAVSYGATGVESIPSNVLIYTPPVPPPVRPRLNLTRQGNGSMKLSCKGTPGQVCAVQFAATPTGSYWQTLTNVTADSVSNVVALDVSAPQVAQRFYRVALAAQELVSALSVTPLSNGANRLSWLAPPFATCRIVFAPYVTSTLWPTLTTVVADAEGRASFVDAGATTAGSRYYKILLP